MLGLSLLEQNRKGTEENLNDAQDVLGKWQEAPNYNIHKPSVVICHVAGNQTPSKTLFWFYLEQFSFLKEKIWMFARVKFESKVQ